MARPHSHPPRPHSHPHRCSSVVFFTIRKSRSPCHVAVLEPRAARQGSDPQLAIADTATVRVMEAVKAVARVGLPLARVSAVPIAQLSALACADCLLGAPCPCHLLPLPHPSADAVSSLSWRWHESSHLLPLARAQPWFLFTLRPQRPLPAPKPRA